MLYIWTTLSAIDNFKILAITAVYVMILIIMIMKLYSELVKIIASLHNCVNILLQILIFFAQNATYATVGIYGGRMVMPSALVTVNSIRIQGIFVGSRGLFSELLKLIATNKVSGLLIFFIY